MIISILDLEQRKARKRGTHSLRQWIVAPRCKAAKNLSPIAITNNPIHAPITGPTEEGTHDWKRRGSVLGMPAWKYIFLFGEMGSVRREERESGGNLHPRHGGGAVHIHIHAWMIVSGLKGCHLGAVIWYPEERMAADDRLTTSI
jgi:hypothetical protein